MTAFRTDLEIFDEKMIGSLVKSANEGIFYVKDDLHKDNNGHYMPSKLLVSTHDLKEEEVFLVLGGWPHEYSRTVYVHLLCLKYNVKCRVEAYIFNKCFEVIQDAKSNEQKPRRRKVHL